MSLHPFIPDTIDKLLGYLNINKCDELFALTDIGKMQPWVALLLKHSYINVLIVNIRRLTYIFLKRSNSYNESSSSYRGCHSE